MNEANPRITRVSIQEYTNTLTRASDRVNSISTTVDSHVTACSLKRNIYNISTNSLCMYVFVYVHVCNYVCMYMYYVCMHVYMYVTMYMSVVHLCNYVCICNYVCTYTGVYVCIYVCKFMYIHVCYVYVCIISIHINSLLICLYSYIRNFELFRRCIKYCKLVFQFIY